MTVRYSGRVCLLGEHCDWAGGLSLTAPLNLGLQVTAEREEDGLRAQAALEGRLLDESWPTRGIIDRQGGPLRFIPAAAAALNAAGIPPEPTRLFIHGDLPAGRGFSSSAALCLGVLDALSRRSGHTLSPLRLAELATHVERDLIGVRCGAMDPLACVAGAPALLRWPRSSDTPIQRLRPGKTAHLVVAAFATARDTVRILAALQEHFHSPVFADHSPPASAAVRSAIATFSSATERGANALEAGNLAALGAAMNTCQHAYDEVASQLEPLAAPRLNHALAELRQLGALGAKFSGAGGDGSVVALFADAHQAETAQHHLDMQPGIQSWSMRLEDR